jgi:phosphotransferase system enzyme I (PtsI)
LSHFGNRPVTLRTLDIGGDKTVCYLNLPKEDNPFLGNRALRFCFSHPEIFKTQLRAAFRASVFGNLQIMLPMVGSLDDIQRAKTIINEVKEDLKSSGIPYREDVKIGIMIEIPSIALMADIVANEVDFASIGTNDLCQYTLAVDRMNSDVCRYYQNFHPAIFRLIGFVADKFIKQNKVISVCGEMGGDPLAATVLIGLGITKLSMGLSSVPRVKKIIADLTMPKARLISDTVCKLATADEIKEYLKAELK